jgi:hypothetical protein
MRGTRVLWALLAAAALGACSSSATTSGPPTSPSTPPATPTPSGPATADITFAGDPALAVPLTKVNILCLEPTLEGKSIEFSGVPQGQPANGLSVYATIHEGNLAVWVTNSSGRRQFSGTGTTLFNPDRGVQLSGSLSETTPAGSKKGTVGAITSISGSVRCGNQTAGTSTVKVSGDTKEGAIDAVPSSVRVHCLSGASGYFVGIRGIVTIGGAPNLVTITLGEKALQLSQSAAGGTAAHFYVTQGQVGTAITSTGGHVDGDVAESVAAGGTAHKLHLKGDAQCGSSVTY